MSVNPFHTPPANGDSMIPSQPLNTRSRRVRLNSARRYLVNHLITGLALLSTFLVILPLVAILIYLLYMGASSLNLAFFTHIPAPVGETGGGMANAIVGSGIVLVLASSMGIPVGIAAGVYLAEFGRGKALASAVRFTADVLNGVPSIVMGIAVYSLIVMQQKHFSAFSGGVALAIMMVPTITRTTEEMLATVPHAIREAALGLGVPKWRTVLSVSLKTASPGIITGCMLAFARVAGETAPLLFTAFGNQFWSFKLGEPIAALPLQIYVYAISPYDEWHRLAWAGSLVLIVMIMAAVTLVRIYASRGMMKGRS
jgi:phosphate transport system permease protein